MQIPEPATGHPPEVSEAILRECGHRATRVAEYLQAHGWTMAEAAWVAVHWDLPTLAAALARERAERLQPLTTLSEVECAGIKMEAGAGERITAPARHSGERPRGDFVGPPAPS